MLTTGFILCLCTDINLNKTQHKYITIIIICLSTIAGVIGVSRMYRNNRFTLSSPSIATSTTNGKKHDQSTKYPKCNIHNFLRIPIVQVHIHTHFQDNHKKKLTPTFSFTSRTNNWIYLLNIFLIRGAMMCNLIIILLNNLFVWTWFIHLNYITKQRLHTKLWNY